MLSPARALRARLVSLLRPPRASAAVVCAALAAGALAPREAAAQLQEQEFSLDTLESMSLEELLNVQVAIASRSRESTALAASIISVIDRERIEREGARTLHEILKTAVAFDTKRGEYNEWFVALRGYDTSANFLVMVDGHRVNSPYDGSVPWDLPLTNVRRIELIRGPGSAVYGSNAFVGVINIITFDEAEPGTEVRAWGWANDSDFRPVYTFAQPLAGVGLRSGLQQGRLRVDVHGSFRADTGDALLVPSDNASLRNLPWSLARCVDQNGETLTANGRPILRVAACEEAGGRWNGRTQNAVRHGEGSLRVKYAGLEWITRVVSDRRGPGMTSPDAAHLFLAYQSQRSMAGVFSQATYTHELGERHDLRARAFYDQRGYDETLGRAPEGFTNRGVVFPEGLTTRRRFTARDLGVELLSDQSLTLGDGFAGALNVNLGLSAERRQVDSSSYEANYDADVTRPQEMADARDQLPPLYYEGTSEPRPECAGGEICTDGRFVNVLSAWAQTRWQPQLSVDGLALAVTAGLRADKETSLAVGLSPRAGLTLTADDDALPIGSGLVKALLPDNVKVLYGSAFRSPTIKDRFDNTSEVFFGNPDLIPERSHSLEAGVGYQVVDGLQVLANYFASDIRNSIQRLYSTSGLEPLRQRATRQVQGVELEVRAARGQLSDAYLNLSLLRGTDTGKDSDSSAAITTHLEDQPKVRLNAGVEVNAFRWLYAGVSGSYTGQRENLQRTLAERGHRFRIPPVFLLNAAVRIKEPLPGLSLQLYGRNLLSTRYRDPLPPNHDTNVKFAAGDEESAHIPRERLTFGVELSYQLPL